MQMDVHDDMKVQECSITIPKPGKSHPVPTHVHQVTLMQFTPWVVSIGFTMEATQIKGVEEGMVYALTKHTGSIADQLDSHWRNTENRKYFKTMLKIALGLRGHDESNKLNGNPFTTSV